MIHKMDDREGKDFKAVCGNELCFKTDDWNKVTCSSCLDIMRQNDYVWEMQNNKFDFPCDQIVDSAGFPINKGYRQ